MSPISETSRMFDGRFQVWRRVVTKDATLSAEIVTYTPIAVYPGAMNRPFAPEGDSGPGLSPIGDRTVYLTAAANVQERDLLEQLTGPEVGTLLEVDGIPARVRGHHTQIRGRIYNGPLPGAS